MTWRLVPLQAGTERGDALAVHLGEETAECRRILVPQQIADLLGALAGIEQQPARFGILIRR